VFVLEGLRLVREALDAGIEPTLVLYDPTLESSELGRQVLDRVRDLPVAFAATPAVITFAAETETPAGLLMVAAEPEPVTLATIHSTPLLLILDHIGDAGNAGTILRTAAAAGLECAAFADGVDPYGGKAVRAGMGAHFRLTPVRVSWLELGPELAAFDQVIGASAAASQTIYDVDWSKRTALVIGSEAHGLTLEAKRHLTTTARVPMAGGVESLNASAVAAIILFHAQRAILEAASRIA
jgi:TrmH family RNA methyltransferase